MKSTMKKLLCMALAIMLLVSAVPVFAAADGGNVTVNIKINGDEGETYSVTAASGDTFAAVYQWVATNLAGMDVSQWNVTKYYYKMTGDANGNEKQGSDVIPGPGRIVVAVSHKPVTLEFDVYFDGIYNKTVTKEVAYGSSVTLNDSLAASVGLNNPADVRTASLAKGQSFTADESAPNIQVLFASNNGSSGSNGGSGSEGGSGSTTASKSVTLNIKNVEGGSIVWTDTRNLSGDSTTVKDLLYYWYGNKSNSWQNSYKVTKAYSSKQDKEVDYEGTIAAGDTVTVVLTPKSGSTVTPPSSTTTPHVSIILNNKTSNFDSYFNVTPVDGRISSTDVDTAYDRVQVPSGYRLVGWRRENVQECKELGHIDCRNLTVSINVLPVFEKVSTTTSDCGYTIDNLSKPGDVVLHVYLNNNFESEHKAYTINSIAKDGKLSLMDDVKDFLKQYYTAKTSDGIEYRGMYVANGYYGVQYISGNKTEVIGGTVLPCGHTELDHKRAEGRVDLNVMLMNAKAKSSSTADSSNPKTGDTIFVPVMVLGLTASALAAAYVIGKKRFAR